MNNKSNKPSSAKDVPKNETKPGNPPTQTKPDQKTVAKPGQATEEKPAKKPMCQKAPRQPSSETLKPGPVANVKPTTPAKDNAKSGQKPTDPKTGAQQQSIVEEKPTKKPLCSKQPRQTSTEGLNSGQKPEANTEAGAKKDPKTVTQQPTKPGSQPATTKAGQNNIKPIENPSSTSAAVKQTSVIEKIRAKIPCLKKKPILTTAERKEEAEAQKLKSCNGLTTSKDDNGLTVFHRAALEHNWGLIAELNEIYSKYLEPTTITKWINSKDNYETTPLYIACMHKNEIEKDRDNFFEKCIEKGADVNVLSKYTMWTPIMWTAFHGDLKMTKVLLDKGACAFIPDKRGFFPIDYAGYFKNKEIVNLLVTHSLQQFDKYQKVPPSPTNSSAPLKPASNVVQPEYCSEHATQSETPKCCMKKSTEEPLREFLLRNQSAMLLNPLYCTSLLYWASHTKVVPVDFVQKILSQMPSYPEGAVSIEQMRTSFHAAAYCGNAQKLDLLMKDFKARVERSNFLTKEQQKAVFSKICVVPTLNAQLNVFEQVILPRKELKQLRWFYNKKFKPGLDKLHMVQAQKAYGKFDVTDDENNTALHYAALKNRKECVELLINTYSLAIDIRNADGIMSKDIGALQSDIRDIIQKNYDSVDKNIASLAKGPTNPKAVKDLESQQLLKKSIAQPMTKEQLVALKKVISIEAAEKYIDSRILEARDAIPSVPKIALKVSSATPQQHEELDRLLRSIDSSNFEMSMFKSLSDKVYFVILDFSYEQLENELKDTGYPCKVAGLNATVPFSDEVKNKILPLQGKDIQTLIYNKFDRLFNIKLLMQKKVLQQIFPLHDDNGLWFVNKQRNLTTRWFPHAFFTFKQYFGEHFQSERFEDLTSMKNYFGEQKAITYAFFEYFTIWMIGPAILSLALTIYQQGFEYKTLLSIPFAWIISVYATVLVERWKRKENHIGYNWGDMCDGQEDELVYNPDFLGQDAFSWTQHELGKKTVGQKHLLFLFLNVFISCCLIALSIAAYFLLNDYVEGFWKGVLVAICAGVVNAIYLKVAVIFVKLENHKYIKDRDGSFALKIVVFRFINTNLSILYAILRAKREADQWNAAHANDYKMVQVNIPYAANPDGTLIAIAAEYIALPPYQDEVEFVDPTELIYKMVFSLIVTRMITCYLVTYALKVVSFQLKKLHYFYKISKLGKAQQKNYEASWETLPQGEKTLIEARNRKAMIICKNVFRDTTHAPPNVEAPEDQAAKKCACCIPKAKVPSPPPTYQRLVFNNSRKDSDCIENNPVFLDAVEINSLMGTTDELGRVTGIVDKLLMISFALLYCGVCPITPLLVFVHFLFEMFLQRWTDCYATQRPIQNSSKTLGSYILFLELMICSVVITNTLMNFVLNSNLRTWLNSEGVESAENQVWLIFGIEHLLLLILVFMKILIPDMPRTLIKLKKLTESMYHKLFGSNSARERQLEAELAKLRGKKKTALEIIQYHEKSVNEIDIKQGTLVDFLGLDPRAHLITQKREQLEISLATNFEIKLFRESFLMIERAILQRRMSKIMNCNKAIIVNCVECANDAAVIYCQDCADHYCKFCGDAIHQQCAKYQQHTRKPLDTNPLSFHKPGTYGGPTVWRKFEYFNFPLPNTHDQFDTLQVHFEKLKKAYVEMNYMDEFTREIDYASVFVDQNYDGLEREYARVMKKKHQKQFGIRSVISQKERLEGTQCFNDEELFYMNRIIYRLYKRYGVQLQFPHFIKDLTLLQTAPFKERLELWLNCVNEHEETPAGAKSIGDLNLERILCKTKIANAVRTSFPQDLAQRMTFEKILEKIYRTDGASEFKDHASIIRTVMADPDATALFKCVLQVE